MREKRIPKEDSTGGILGIPTIGDKIAQGAVKIFIRILMGTGRGNRLHQSVYGARSGAFFYSLVDTAKANGLEPFKYLRYLFTETPNVKELRDYKKLPPMYVDP